MSNEVGFRRRIPPARGFRHLLFMARFVELRRRSPWTPWPELVLKIGSLDSREFEDGSRPAEREKLSTSRVASGEQRETVGTRKEEWIALKGRESNAL